MKKRMCLRYLSATMGGKEQREKAHKYSVLGEKKRQRHLELEDRDGCR
jgi:hypothetical protein